FTLDSKDPTASYQDFLKGEVRYTSLAKQFPDAAGALFEKNEADAKVRLARYKEMAATEK
ncbi:MAG: pyruvate-flavodoxin oxidoreductase, partial [Clostridia bacterium]|nr:pyruvate-flavodoxin oxidoreductase [Clostridia bacterium]